MDGSKFLPTPVRTWVLDRSIPNPRGLKLEGTSQSLRALLSYRQGRQDPQGRSNKITKPRVSTLSYGCGESCVGACGTVAVLVSQRRFLQAQGLTEEKACVNVNFVFECESVCGAMDV